MMTSEPISLTSDRDYLATLPEDKLLTCWIHNSAERSSSRETCQKKKRHITPLLTNHLQISLDSPGAFPLFKLPSLQWGK